MATTAGLFAWGWGVLRFGDMTRMAGSTSFAIFLNAPSEPNRRRFTEDKAKPSKHGGRTQRNSDGYRERLWGKTKEPHAAAQILAGSSVWNRSS